MPFDGQYVDVLAVRGRTVADLERAYWAGEVNATWYCTRCHQRDDETIKETRVRIECFDTKRMERTTELVRKGYWPKR